MTSCFKTYSATALAAALFWSGTATAANAKADAAADARGEGATDIIVTGNPDPLMLNTRTQGANRLDISALDTPASVETLDGAAIRLRGDQTIQAAAARATGIVNASGVFGYSLTARGFSGQNSVMQLYDGMRMYNNTLTFPADPWMADRVEVLRGPASVLYGEGAIGGAVNVVRKQPDARLGGEFQTGTGSYGSYVAAGGVGGPVNDKLSFRFDAAWRGGDGWMARGDSHSLAMSGTIQYKPTETLTLSISQDHSVQKPRTWFGVPTVNGALDASLARNNYNVTNAELRFRDDWTQVKIAWNPTDSIAVQSDFYYLSATKYWKNAESVTYVNATTVRQSSFLELYHIQRQWGNRTTASVEHTLFGLDNHVLVGFDVNTLSYTNISNSGNNATRDIAIDGSNTGLFINQGGTAATQTRYTNHIHQYSIFSEDRLMLSDQFSIVAGLRYDRPKVEKTDFINAANNFTSVPDAVTWRAGAVFKPMPSLSLYAQYATAADPVGALVSTSFAQRNALLSTGRQWEAGLKHIFWQGRGQWTFAAYDIIKKNLLVTNPADSNNPFQAGQQSSRGLELSFSLEPVKSLTITLNGTVLKARYDDFQEPVSGKLVSRAGNRPTNVPQKTANAFASWEFLKGMVIDGGVSYVGDRWQDAANTRYIPAYTVADIGLRWQFIPNVSADVRVSNLFDKTYAKATYGSTQWVLGDPRTVMVTLNGAF
ncbi:MAG TPA: TonB-dependent siderophore receptor [Sphingobium sp.]|uniref:TonB-dependent receptor n=1 Tax=Sphingobium sp. TaxID=1912891 RepID=UPI002ED32FB6